MDDQKADSPNSATGSSIPLSARPQAAKNGLRVEPAERQPTLAENFDRRNNSRQLTDGLRAHPNPSRRAPRARPSRARPRCCATARAWLHARHHKTQTLQDEFMGNWSRHPGYRIGLAKQQGRERASRSVARRHGRAPGPRGSRRAASPGGLAASLPTARVWRGGARFQSPCSPRRRLSRARRPARQWAAVPRTGSTARRDARRRGHAWPRSPPVPQDPDRARIERASPAQDRHRHRSSASPRRAARAEQGLRFNKQPRAKTSRSFGSRRSHTLRG